MKHTVTEDIEMNGCEPLIRRKIHNSTNNYLMQLTSSNMNHIQVWVALELEFYSVRVLLTIY